MTFNLCAQGLNSPMTSADFVFEFEKIGDTGIIGKGVLLGRSIAENIVRPGGDNLVGEFMGNGWLELRNQIKIENNHSFTIALRFNPQKSGGLIRTNFCSLVLHESGLLIAQLPVKDSLGLLFKEFPLASLKFGNWHEIVFRYEKGRMSLIRNGTEVSQFTLLGSIHPIYSEPVLIGTWRMEEPPGAGLPQPAKNWLYERPFKGAMDYVAIWKNYLSDAKVASLISQKSIGRQSEKTDQQRVLSDYVAFQDASRRKDTVACEQLGLEMRSFMARDPRRPIYHLTSPMDGMFDPAGAFYHRGRYHVFSYRNMVSLLADNALAHYESDDLIHWKDRPIAIWPDTELDFKGIWLANLFYDDQKKPFMLYTSLGKKGKIGVLARADDNLISVSDKKVVMPNVVHHDGHVWKDGDKWYSITTQQYWGKLNGKTGDGILLLSSPDLMNWKAEGEIFNIPAVPNPADDNQKNGLTEFPYLLPFGEKYVLMTGTRPVKYWIGKFDKEKPGFIPDEPDGKLLDFLNNFHCFNPSAIDQKGPDGAQRRIIMAMNINTMGNVEGIPWFGVHVLPRILARDGDRLTQEPVPEVEKLRDKHDHFGPVTVHEDDQSLLPVKGDAVEIVAEFNAGSAKRFGLKVRASSDGKSATRVYYDVANDRIGAEGNLKITSPYKEIGSARSFQKPGQSVKIRLFLDRSLLEVFVNGQAGSGILTSDPASLGIGLFSEGGDAELLSLDVWQMKSTWPLLR